MQETLPEPIMDFELFLVSKGMDCQRREGPDSAVFGNRLLQFGNERVGVRLVLDRSAWTVQVSDAIGHPQEWYDGALLCSFLLGTEKEAILVAEQVACLKANWSTILSCFDPTQREDTHSRLSLLRKERAKRLFPGLYNKTEPS